MASTRGGIIAHVSSASATSESVSLTEKLLKTMKRAKQKVFLQTITSAALDFTPQPSQFIINTMTSNYMCILSFVKFVTIVLLLTC